MNKSLRWLLGGFLVMLPAVILLTIPMVLDGIPWLHAISAAFVGVVVIGLAVAVMVIGAMLLGYGEQ